MSYCSLKPNPQPCCNRLWLSLPFWHQVLSYFLGMFHNALDQPDLRSTSVGTALSAQEIKLVLDTFLFSNRNVETILDRDVLPLLFSFVAKGKVTEKEKAFKSLLVISSKSSRGKGHIISHLRANYGKPGIQEAAKSLGLEQKRPQMTQGNLLFYTFLKVLDSKLVWKNHIFILHPGD